MAKAYGQEAIEHCRALYCKYGGRNFEAIEAEMQRTYPGWRISNLKDRKRLKGDKEPQLGWINRYGFDNSLKLHLQKLTENVNDDEQDLYLGIKTVRKGLQTAVVGGAATKDEIYQYRDFAKLEIEARRNLDLSRDNLETFVSGYEKLVVWLGDIDPAAAKLLVKNGDRLADMAKAHYGKAEADIDGASNQPDESGGEPYSLLA